MACKRLLNPLGPGYAPPPGFRPGHILTAPPGRPRRTARFLVDNLLDAADAPFGAPANGPLARQRL